MSVGWMELFPVVKRTKLLDQESCVRHCFAFDNEMFDIDRLVHNSLSYRRKVGVVKLVDDLY